MITLFLKRMILNGVILLFYSTLSSPIGCSEKVTPVITINGSTTEQPIMDMVSTAYTKKKDVNIIIQSEGSKTGIDSLINGQCDIAMSSSRISPSLMEEAESKKLNLKEFIFAYDMIVPIIHPSNPVQNLSLQQLRDIFTGAIESWKEVGGKTEKILVAHRNTSSGTRDVWNEMVLKSENAPKDHVFLQSNSEVLAYVKTNHSAIGYISFGYVNNEIKTASVNDIEPTLQNAVDKRFPILRNLYLYVTEENFSNEIKSFIIYLLSNEGQEIVKQGGFIPLYPFSFKK
jgi:phosphate transport system substrate-binding protein